MFNVSPVSSSVLSFAITIGQPPLTLSATLLPGSKSSWTTVSLTASPAGSISNVTFDRGSAANGGEQLVAELDHGCELRGERVPRIREATAGVGFEHHLVWDRR